MRCVAGITILNQQDNLLLQKSLDFKSFLKIDSPKSSCIYASLFFNFSIYFIYILQFVISIIMALQHQTHRLSQYMRAR